MFFLDVMEPKLFIYRSIMILGLILFCLSYKVNYFPTGFVCVLAAIFSVFYLWEELICKLPPRTIPRLEPIENADIIFPSLYAIRNPQVISLFLFFLYPLLVWYVASFGFGFALHTIFSSPEKHEYVVSPLKGVRRGGGLRWGSYGYNFFPSMNIKNMKTYSFGDLKIPDSQFQRIEYMRNVTVTINSDISWFGTSFDKNFIFEEIRQ